MIEICPECGDTGPHFVCFDQAGEPMENEAECRACGHHFDPEAGR